MLKDFIESNNQSKKDDPNNCSNCGSTPDQHKLENYDMMWHDGDVMCTVCGEKVRDWDAG